MFKTIYTCSGIDRTPSNPGNRTRPKYKPVYNENGSYVLEESGVVNSYDDIQSWRDSCDLSLLIEKYNMTGDASILNVNHGFYADVTEMPKTYAEMQNAILEAENYFYTLPLDIREKFNQSPSEFIAQIGTPGFTEKLSPNVPEIIEKDVVITNKEVVEDAK